MMESTGNSAHPMPVETEDLVMPLRQLRTGFAGRIEFRRPHDSVHHDVAELSNTAKESALQTDLHNLWRGSELRKQSGLWTQYGTLVVILTVASFVAGAIANGWYSAAVLALIALIESGAVLVHHRKRSLRHDQMRWNSADLAFQPHFPPFSDSVRRN